MSGTMKIDEKNYEANSLTVVLEKDTKAKELQTLISCIEQLKGVLSVTSNKVNINDHVAKKRLLKEMKEKIFDTFKD